MYIYQHSNLNSGKLQYGKVCRPKEIKIIPFKIIKYQNKHLHYTFLLHF